MIEDEPKERAPKDFLVREKVWEVGGSMVEIDPDNLPVQLPDGIANWVMSEYPDDEEAMAMANRAWADFKDRERGNY